MTPVKFVKVRSYEKGFYFRDREFVKILDKGRYWFADPLFKVKIDVMSQREPWLNHPCLDMIVKSGALKGEAVVLDLKDYERALVWIDNRFTKVLGPGLYALWNKFREIRVEIVDAADVMFEHKDKNVIRKSFGMENQLTAVSVDQGFTGLFYRDGKFVETFQPGQYLFWKNMGKVKFFHVDMRETVLDVAGQDIMTSDKVTLRVNAVVNYRVTDPRKSVEAVDDSRQAMYREAQLALRAVIGIYDLDQLLTDKEAVAQELEKTVSRRAAEFGLKIISLGIRDVILPGEMKFLMNKVIEARKAADANLITRREEVAAMRSQANTAKILENNPTLMRLRELDVLEKIAANTKMNVVLGEKGLAERVVNLL